MAFVGCTPLSLVREGYTALRCMWTPARVIRRWPHPHGLPTRFRAEHHAEVLCRHAGVCTHGRNPLVGSFLTAAGRRPPVAIVVVHVAGGARAPRADRAVLPTGGAQRRLAQAEFVVLFRSPTCLLTGQIVELPSKHVAPDSLLQLVLCRLHGSELHLEPCNLLIQV